MPQDPIQRAFTRAGKYLGEFLYLIIIVISLLVLSWALSLPETNIWRELLRDVAIAGIVSVVVGGVFELHVRSKFYLDTVERVLGAIVNDLVRPDVWQEVKKQVIERDYIRESADIKLSLMDDPTRGLPPGAMLLWMGFGYNVCGLRSTKRKAEIVHRLDDHLSDCGFPKLLSFKVDGVPIDIKVEKGWFKYLLDVNEQGGKSRHITTERQELVYIPGSYNLTMSAMTKGIKIFLSALPKGVSASVSIRPHRDPVNLVVNDTLDTEFENVLLLPGQLIEFRFTRDDDFLSIQSRTSSMKPGTNL
ncbi:MAG: hypothetical protein ACJ8GN_01440 [Longimicrobiaceae bacterium]